jgi:hypothetical protein
MFGLFNLHRLVIEPYFEGLSPEALIHIHPNGVEPNLAILTDLAPAGPAVH